MKLIDHETLIKFFFAFFAFERLWDFGTTKNSAYSNVCQKRHYRYPIVAFYINAAIGISVVALIYYIYIKAKGGKRPIAAYKKIKK